MNIKNSFSKHRNIYFVVLWLLYVSFNFFVRVVENLGAVKPIFLPDTLFKYSLAFLLFFVSHKLIFRVLFNRPLILVFSLLMSLIIFSTIRFVFYKHIFSFILKDYGYYYYYWESFVSSSWWWIQYVTLAFCYHIFITKINLNKELQNSQQANHELERKNLKLQYKFLRAQINPHFLYNVLGYFYGKVKEKDANAGRAIELLTAMMRYSIREGEADDKVALSDELHAIRNLLELQQIRFGNTTFIREKIEAGLEHLRIVPHILVTIVENACKHGDLTNSEAPLQIKAFTSDGWFVFEVRNKLRTSRTIEQGDGTGLINLEERINLQYLDQQQFSYGTLNGYFRVLFKLSIKRMEMDALEQKTEMLSQSILNPTDIKQTVWLPA